MPDESPKWGGDWASGFAVGIGVSVILVGLPIAMVGLSFAFRYGTLRLASERAFELLLPLALGVGASQFLFIGPLIWWYRRQQRRGMVIGLIVAAAVTSLLNVICWAAR
jgi:hypothetical protein